MKFLRRSKDLKKPYFLQLSIQQRLSLLICVLLLIVVVIFSAASFFAMRDTAMKLGNERLSALSQQLSSLFSGSSQALSATTRNFAREQGLIDFLQSGGTKNRLEAMQVLDKITHDTLTRSVQVWNANGQKMLTSGKNDLSNVVGGNAKWLRVSKDTSFTHVGKVYLINDSMYFPVISVVTINNNVIGYISRWQKVFSTRKALDELSELLGTKATIYFANSDRKFWTDLMKPVPGPPVARLDFQNTMTYTSSNGVEVLAAARPIQGTEWLILIEFSRRAVLGGAKTFVYWILMLGAGLIVVGSLLAWMMSRNITRPLNKLTNAASSISKGNYGEQVELNRHDELGKLAKAFQIMSVQIQNAQIHLEKKVKDRTMQLEMANKELEAFSYSVSHDLKAPLRAISGYSAMLKEDYEGKLDSEGNRILNTIVSNAKMMGTLIDDLISFSRIGRKEITRQPIHMKALAESCLTDLLEREGVIRQYKVKLENLPPTTGDQAMIRQVWINLIGNAIKYSSKKEAPSIEIGYREEQYTNVYFVKDNGIGFDMKYSHKLFGVFQRLHNPDHFEGTGIGLALVQRILNKHGGEIWAHSEPGEGATFYFRLPKINTPKDG